MEVSTDEGLYSDDEEEEGTWAGETHGKEGADVGYAEVETLCLARDAREDEKMQLHLQAIMRAGREGQLDARELQALFNLRAEREQEKQWAQAEVQWGLVQMGSPMPVADLAAVGQRAAGALMEAQFT